MTFLWYVYQCSDEQMPERSRKAIAVAKYIVAVLVSTFGSGAIAALIALPLLIYARLTHNEAATNLFAALVDRPYFPLQIAVAFVAGLILTKWLKDGNPALAWVLPVAQFSVVLAMASSRQSVLDSYRGFVWNTFFNWGCNCSASLLQWEAMFPLYTSIAFSVAAWIRGLQSAEPISSRVGTVKKQLSRNRIIASNPEHP